MWPFKRQSKHAELLPDDVWLNEPAKHRGIVARIEQHMGAAPALLLLVHYQWTMDALQKLLDGLSFVKFVGDEVDLPRTLTNEVRALSGVVVVTRVESLPRVDHVREERRADLPTLPVLVADRSHSRAADERAIQFAEHLPMRTTVQFHSSLDDPLLSIFTGQTMLDMLRKLGMTEDEPIQSPIVSRAISRSQAKLESEYGEIDLYDDREQLIDRLRQSR